MKFVSLRWAVFLSLLFSLEPVLPKFRFGNKTSSIELSDSNSFLVLGQQVTGFNGTLKLADDAQGRVSGQGIVFQDGILCTQNVAGSDVTISGTYSTAAGEEIDLQNNGIFNVALQKTINKKIKIPAGCSASVIGFPIFDQSIDLADQTCELKLGIKTPLNRDINLNGGTITLVDNLTKTADSKFAGTGTINVNNYKLTLSGGQFSSGKITLVGAQDLELSANLVVNSELNFNSGSANPSVLIGDSFIAQFQTGGFFSLNSGQQLICSETFFKGLGNYPNYGFFSMPPTSTTVFQNSTLELTGNYTHSNGTILFKGDRCKIISNGYTFTTTGTAAWICVDGVPLEYDSLAGIDSNPFVFTAESSQKIFSNGGTIRSTLAASGDIASLIIDNALATFITEFTLSNANTITFSNTTPATPKPMTLNFSGQNLYFPSQGSSLFNLESNVQLTTSNIILFNFNKNAISYGDSNATLSFGSGTQIRLFDDVLLSSGDKPWNFSGNGQICGCGTTIILDGSNLLTVGSSSTLTLRNLRIFCKNVDSLACLDQSSKIVLENCTIVVGAAGLEFSKGNIDINGFVQVVGGDATTIETPASLTFSAQGLFRVLTQSKLKINQGIEFVYKADPANNGTNTSATKRHFLLIDPTSTLQLDGASLHSTTTAFALDYGRLVIEDKVNFIVDGTDAQSAEIGSAVEVCVKTGAVFEVEGIIKYINSSF